VEVWRFIQHIIRFIEIKFNRERTSLWYIGFGLDGTSILTPKLWWMRYGLDETTILTPRLWCIGSYPNKVVLLTPKLWYIRSSSNRTILLIPLMLCKGFGPDGITILTPRLWCIGLELIEQFFWHQGYDISGLAMMK
jgi:hypothetical protein